MATDTYLQLVTNVIVETGLNAGVPPLDVADTGGDAAKVAYWVQVADLQLQRERIDWDFLWVLETVQLQQGSNLVPTPTHWPSADHSDPNQETALINSIAKKKLAVVNSDGEPFFPTYMHWDEFSILYNYQTEAASDFPSYWTISPDKKIHLSAPIESSDMNCKYEYWRKPIKMRENSDTSRIPDDFDRLIVLLAKILYAEHEDAPEVDVGSNAHYDVMLNMMISTHAPMAEWQRMENSDEYLTVDTRGFGEGYSRR